MVSELEARRKELRSLLDDLRSRLVREELDEPAYLELRARAEEEMERARAERELRQWTRAVGALLVAAGVLLFLATTRVLASGTPSAGPSPEASALVFLQWLSAAPFLAGLLLLLRSGRGPEETLETHWVFRSGPEQVRRALSAVLRRRGGRMREREGWVEASSGHGDESVRLKRSEVDRALRA